MEWWTAFQAFILGVVEGLTEFLPISSTGHQIIVADLIGFGGERAKAFNIDHPAGGDPRCRLGISGKDLSSRP